MTSENHNDLSFKIIGAAIEVHRILGPGLMEKIYRSALAYELREMGIKAEEEVLIPLSYKKLLISDMCRADIIVGNQIIVELKATEKDNDLYAKQLLTYLKLSGLKLGLVINFNRLKLKDGISRIINNNGIELPK